MRWLVILAAMILGCTSSPAPSPTAPDRTSTPTSSLPATTTSQAETTTTSPPPEGATLRVGTAVPVTSLDPADAFTLGDWELLQAVGDGLLIREPGNGSIVPGIAEDLPEVSDDGRTYTLRLREGVEFADGLPLTAPLYVEGIQRVMQLGGQGSDLVSLFVDSVEAVDESTVIFHLRDGFAFFPTLLAGAPYLPVHPDVYPTDELVQFPETPVYGVGPWFIESYSEAEVVLAANPRYAGEDVVPDQIVIHVYETAAEMVDALTAGDLDLIWRGVGSQSASALADVEGINVALVPGGTVHFLTANHGLEPTNDPAVRQAIAELVERGPIVETVLGGAFEPAFAPVPAGFLGSSDSFFDVYGEADVSDAIEALSAAGYTESEPAQLELAYPPERFGPQLAGAMEQIELQIEATGLVDVTLTSQPWSTYVGDVVEGVYNLAFLGWLHDFPDPHNYLAPFVLDGGLGGSGENLESPELIDLVTEAATEFDEEQREALYAEVQRLYAEDVVTIPLWVQHEYIAYRDHVSGTETFASPESLNVGVSVQLDYRAIEITPPEEG